ncbi:hypothetical protein HPB49_005888 [Dermacentor silvarum]|uniref:Uncharacterized protein n=1 Tax=Dermacentor silvarum TaxID=543639 RepID=A0ACB8C7H1_DERSI|nr:hypothetical protein HPB49_005888 [Dermacentor silvarum]
MHLSAYARGLDKRERLRYEEKVRLCGGVDPLELKDAELQRVVGLLPRVDFTDIKGYLVHGTSFVSREQLKLYKSMEGHNYLTSGWVQQPFDKLLLLSERFQDGTFDEYFEVFLDGRNAFGSYYESLRSWYSKRNEPNVLFLTYEGMHADVRGSVLKITRFIDAGIADELARDEDKVRTVLENSSFSSMKKQFALQFVRKGTVGDWRNYFSPEQSRRLEERFFREMDGTDIPQLWEGAGWLFDEPKT